MFSCHFDPGWYPFDDQTCKVVIGMDRDSAFVQYNAVGIRFTGIFALKLKLELCFLLYHSINENMYYSALLDNCIIQFTL